MCDSLSFYRWAHQQQQQQTPPSVVGSLVSSEFSSFRRRWRSALRRRLWLSSVLLIPLFLLSPPLTPHSKVAAKVARRVLFPAAAVGITTCCRRDLRIVLLQFQTFYECFPLLSKLRKIPWYSSIKILSCNNVHSQKYFKNLILPILIKKRSTLSSRKLLLEKFVQQQFYKCG